ncbi:hypothetical protein DM860_010028 [Cuscuta australis]|uniref:Geraniol 8-hydroxylase n=1 Tax=Cuscuta australis TaxID=267555 RepID=A0A328D718_9ASTE|nr:hypothetical protein DM860_010028 [Cuscuta australis]
MDSISSCGVLFLFLALYTLHSLLRTITKTKHKKKLPPGPSIFTLISNLSDLFHKPQQTLARLAEEYGPVMRVQIAGRETTVIVSSDDMAREILHTHDALFSDRSVPDVTTAHDHNLSSLVFLPVSPLWQDLRKICHQRLFSNNTLDRSENLRRKKLQDLLGDMHQSSIKGEVVDVGRAAFKACINFLSYTFVSQDFIVKSAVDDDGEFKDLVSTLLKATGTPNVVDFLPVLKIFDPQGVRRHTASYLTRFFRVLDRLIDDRVRKREGESYLSNNDMLDTLLDISQEDIKRMDRKKIRHLLLDLLVAGTDTTAYGLEKALSELVHNPEVMSKAKRELEQTIGLGKAMEESDIGRLPYLEAVVKESLRLHPPAPLLLPRRAKTDVLVPGGYTIPRGAQVLINEWAIGRSETAWEDANSFLPERFLGSEIDVKGRHFKLTPFGSGRRICPGSPLAIRMMHLMLGSLINSFDWRLEGNMDPKDMDFDKPLRAIPISVKC